MLQAVKHLVISKSVADEIFKLSLLPSVQTQTMHKFKRTNRTGAKCAVYYTFHAVIEHLLQKLDARCHKDLSVLICTRQMITCKAQTRNL